MMRIVFMRKNRTILSQFKQKQILDTLERNYRVVCNAKGKVKFSGYTINNHLMFRILQMIFPLLNILSRCLLVKILLKKEPGECQSKNFADFY
jgi:hypothetical protein